MRSSRHHQRPSALLGSSSSATGCPTAAGRGDLRSIAACEGATPRRVDAAHDAGAVDPGCSGRATDAGGARNVRECRGLVGYAVDSSGRVYSRLRRVGLRGGGHDDCRRRRASQTDRGRARQVGLSAGPNLSGATLVPRERARVRGVSRASADASPPRTTPQRRSSRQSRCKPRLGHERRQPRRPIPPRYGARGRRRAGGEARRGRRRGDSRRVGRRSERVDPRRALRRPRKHDSTRRPSRDVSRQLLTPRFGVVGIWCGVRTEPPDLRRAERSLATRS